MTSTTTAQRYGKLYGELVQEGIPDELAGDIVRDAARALIPQNGFTVAVDEAGEKS